MWMVGVGMLLATQAKPKEVKPAPREKRHYCAGYCELCAAEFKEDMEKAKRDAGKRAQDEHEALLGAVVRARNLWKGFHAFGRFGLDEETNAMIDKSVNDCLDTIAENKKAREQRESAIRLEKLP